MGVILWSFCKKGTPEVTSHNVSYTSFSCFFIWWTSQSPVAKSKNVSSFHTASACLTCSWELPYVLIFWYFVLDAYNPVSSFTKLCGSFNFSAAVFKTASSGCLWITLVMEWYIILNLNQRMLLCSHVFAHVFQLLLKLKHTWNVFLRVPASETSWANGITLAGVMLLFSKETVPKHHELNTPTEIQSEDIYDICLTGISDNFFS